MLQVWDSVWIALVTSAVLFGCYRAVEWRWPERYIGMYSTFGLSTQETWARFLAYRAVPTYVFTATCCVTVERVGGYTWLAALVVWLASVVLTHGRVIARGLVRREGEVNYASYHLVMLVVLSATVAMAAIARGAWATLVPSPDDLLSAAWSGLVVAGLGGFIVVTLRSRDSDAPAYGPEYFVERAEREVGVGAFDFLHGECIRQGADPLLMKSLLVVEAIQRPLWLRNLERLSVRLRIARTSGVMQVTSSEPLSDEESIRLAVKAYAGTSCLRIEGEGDYRYWSVDLGEMWGAMTKHNPDGKFARQVQDVARHLLHNVAEYIIPESADAPIILELRRYPLTFALRGMTTADELSLVEVNGVARYHAIARPAIVRPGGWWAWEQEISPASRRVAVVDRASRAGAAFSIQDGQIVGFEPRSGKDAQ